MDLVLGNASGPLGRPVSMASFVLEGLYSGGSIVVSKQVNIALHLLNGLSPIIGHVENVEKSPAITTADHHFH